MRWEPLLLAVPGRTGAETAAKNTPLPFVSTTQVRQGAGAFCMSDQGEHRSPQRDLLVLCSGAVGTLWQAIRLYCLLFCVMIYLFHRKLGPVGRSMHARGYLWLVLLAILGVAW